MEGKVPVNIKVEGLDPLFMATSLFRRRRFEECVEICTMLLEKNPFDQAAWFLKLRALTEQTYVDEVEYEEEGLAETLLDENAIASLPRPGTSLRVPTRGGGTSQGIRPLSQSGRPLSGFVRPGTLGGRPGTMEQALRTPRTATTARPVTSASGRHVRLGTVSVRKHR
jgi:tetratricopeptide repeat protein 8